jgi:hypothetical protein
MASELSSSLSKPEARDRATLQTYVERRRFPGIEDSDGPGTRASRPPASNSADRPSPGHKPGLPLSRLP